MNTQRGNTSCLGEIIAGFDPERAPLPGMGVTLLLFQEADVISQEPIRIRILPLSELLKVVIAAAKSLDWSGHSLNSVCRLSPLAKMDLSSFRVIVCKWGGWEKLHSSYSTVDSL